MLVVRMFDRADSIAHLRVGLHEFDDQRSLPAVLLANDVNSFQIIISPFASFLTALINHVLIVRATEGKKLSCWLFSCY